MPSPKTLMEALNGGHTLIATCRHSACRFRREADIERLSTRLSGRTNLLARPGEVHFTDLMRCPSCRRMGMDLWLEFREAPVERNANPNYTIMDCGSTYPYSLKTTVATANNLFIGRAAYIATALFYKERRITLQQGTFVLQDSKREPIPSQMTPEDFQSMRDGEMALAGMPVKKDKPKAS
ncbi:hypothetical protein [Devosia sp. 2618]|uniref:hypothetical protein n=1 Tax=Devosia sp. 2618 TaxID=3156454 RepID=UPI0033928F45